MFKGLLVVPEHDALIPRGRHHHVVGEEAARRDEAVVAGEEREALLGVEVPNAHNKTHANDRPIAIGVVQVLDMAYRSMPGQGVAPIVLARRT